MKQLLQCEGHRCRVCQWDFMGSHRWWLTT